MKRLSLFEATGLLVVAGVGGGVMAVPFLASRVGLAAFVPVAAAAAGVTVLLNLLLADVLLRDGRDLQIVELIRDYVLRGPAGSAASWLLFSALGLSFAASLTAYIVGAGTVLSDLSGLSPLAAQLLVYAASASLVALGLKSVGVSEAGALVMMVLVLGVIAAGSVGSWRSGVPAFRAEAADGAAGRRILALFGVVMYSLNAVFAVPQAVQGLGRRRRDVLIAGVAAPLLTAAIVFVLTLVAMAVSDPVTEVAIVGIAARTPGIVSLAGSLFVMIAMLSTYWSVSLALADIVAQRTGAGRRISWVLATLPTAVLVILRPMRFIGYLQIAGGIVALIIGFVTVPLFLRSRRRSPVGDAVLPAGGAVLVLVLAIVGIGMALMALGSFLGLAG